MSLEAAIEKLVESTNKLVDVTERLYSLRADAIETVKATAAPKDKKSDAKAEETKPAETKAADPKPTETASADGPSPHDKLKAAIANYMKHDDKAEREARQGKILGLFKVVEKGAKVEVKVHTNIPEKFVPQVIEQIEKLVAAGDVLKPAEAEAGDGETSLFGE